MQEFVQNLSTLQASLTESEEKNHILSLEKVKLETLYLSLTSSQGALEQQIEVLQAEKLRLQTNDIEERGRMVVNIEIAREKLAEQIKAEKDLMLDKNQACSEKIAGNPANTLLIHY